MTQLNVAADLDPINLLMAQVGRPAVAVEALACGNLRGQAVAFDFGRAGRLAGRWLLEANKLLANGHTKESAELREKAFEAAPATSGTINGQAFEWIADADQRFGPVLEAMMDGKYYWIPMHRISRIEMEAPTDLRDLVWAPAEFTWSTGAKAVGLLPVRYPGTEKLGDAAAKLSRSTEWRDEGGTSIGIGQRLLTTDAVELPLLELRELVLNTAPVVAPQEAAAEGA